MARRFEDLQLDPLQDKYVLLEVTGTWPNLVGIYYIIGCQLMADRYPHYQIIPMRPGYRDPDPRTNLKRIKVYFDKDGIINQIPKIG